MKDQKNIASNGITITDEDLEKAIKLANVDWAEAAYANDGAKSKDPIDICIFDFWRDSWDLVDEIFVDNYEDCDEDKHTALAKVIEGRASIWHDWANQAKEAEEEVYRVKGEPFSFDYAKLFIACNNAECGCYSLGEGADAVLSKSFSTRHYSGRNKAKGLVRYHSSFIWNDVEYCVTQYYKDKRIKQGDINDLPDFITIKVKEVKD